MKNAFQHLHWKSIAPRCPAMLTDASGESPREAHAMTTTPQSTYTVRTRTVPEMLQGGTFEGPNVVTGLLVYGTDVEFDLSPTKKRFTLGAAPGRDVPIQSPFVSALHCRLDRKLLGLRVTDEGSKNGTY